MITTLKTTTYPVTELYFPAVTICGSGKHMNLVEKVCFLFGIFSHIYIYFHQKLYNHFLNWKETHKSNAADSELIYEYMKEKFQITDNKITILDILNTIISPEAEQTNSVTQNTVACAMMKNRRKKRELEAEKQKGNNQ